jgi:hypothetical protein
MIVLEIVGFLAAAAAISWLAIQASRASDARRFWPVITDLILVSILLVHHQRTDLTFSLALAVFYTGVLAYDWHRWQGRAQVPERER